MSNLTRRQWLDRLVDTDQAHYDATTTVFRAGYEAVQAWSRHEHDEAVTQLERGGAAWKKLERISAYRRGEEDDWR
jgi:hypothetical protein